MMRFLYKCGDAPLEGYTIRRGLGAGGFGEVYLAISEGGKLVALKLIRKATDKERRGISHCINLKHPNLVHLYDLKQDNEHRHWLVMEYVHGESLKQAIRRHGGRLPRELVHQWFLELCKSVSFLHDQGVIHRDLKPDNIFIEQGSVKLGDYGLCKAVSAENLESATGHIGTAIYMAPEVWRNKSGVPVDVYACGIVLYELLAGRPPFQGSSHELMVAHTSDDPDLSIIPDVYHPILKRALHKDPEKRYRSVADLARDVQAVIFATESTSVPERLNPVASLPIAPNSLEATTLEYPAPALIPPSPKLAVAPRSSPSPPAAARHTGRGRLGNMAVGLMTSCMLALPVAFLGGFAHHADEGYAYGFGQSFFMTVAICWAVVMTGRLMEPSGRKGSVTYRVVLGISGALIGFGLVWLEGWEVTLLPDPASAKPEELYLGGLVAMHPEGWGTAMSFALYLGLSLSLVRWSAMVGRDREERLSGFPVGEAAFWGVILWFIWSWADPPTFTVAALIGSAVIVQMVSPWTAPREMATQTRRRVRLAS